MPGYLLFATNGQINVLVPGALSTVTTAGVVNVQVGYDTATPAAVGNSSAVFPLNAVTSNPGVFTVSSNGRGAGAVTDATSFALNTQSAAATSTTDTVAIYMTGLGIPNGADVVNGSPATDGAACVVPLGAAGSTSVAPGGFMGAVNTPYNTGSIFSPATGFTVPAWTSIDGAVIRSALTATSRLASSLPQGPSSRSGAQPPPLVSPGLSRIPSAASTRSTPLCQLPQLAAGRQARLRKSRSWSP